MPQGRYLSTAIGVSPQAGGQTRAMLMRNRMLVREAGLRPTILMFGANHDLDEQREILLDRGMLIDDLPMVNIYEHYRDNGWGDVTPSGNAPPDLRRYKSREESHSNGTPWRVCYDLPDSGKRVYEYLRADGSPFLRIPSFLHAEAHTWPNSILAMDKAGEVVAEFGSAGDWYRRWVRELTRNDERAFVFIDTRRLIPHLVPMKPARVHLIYLMHNVHINLPRRWNSPMHEIYQRVLHRIGGMDAMVTLTQRQREDIAQRQGATRNMFVVPNPVDLPEPPAQARPRDPHRVTVVGRLEKQKRLNQAIAVFEHVAREVPEARLDIYGDGSQRPALESEIAERGLGDKVTLHGHDPHAREALWTSSVFLMTSSFEGYPLSTLESMSHGCPVVSYDIKYGPREQITDGVDGFLVPAGDIEGAATRVVEMLRSPDLVERMSLAARRKAEKHGHGEFLSDWAKVVQATIDLKPYRTHLSSVEFELRHLRWRPSRGVRRLVSRARPVRAPAVYADTDVDLAGTLRVEGHSPMSGLDSAQLSLSAIHRRSGLVTELPLRFERHGQEFRIGSSFRVADAVADGDDAEAAHLRLRLTWQNRSWDTTIRVPGDDGSVLELARRHS